MKDKLVIVSVHIPRKMLEHIDKIVVAGYFSNRSEFIRATIANYLSHFVTEPVQFEAFCMACRKFTVPRRTGKVIFIYFRGKLREWYFIVQCPQCGNIGVLCRDGKIHDLEVFTMDLNDDWTYRIFSEKVLERIREVRVIE
ncbi:MAG: ribbon-helix-helix domain-containing protein [Candidatus Nezhaarchaeales archaeon]